MKTFALTAAALASALAFAPQATASAGGPKGCPPGLAKKGCVPPGQAKKYQVGYPLDRQYPYVRDWRRYDLPEAPRGYRYAKIDRDIVLVAEATRKVVEVVAILDILTN